MIKRNGAQLLYISQNAGNVASIKQNEDFVYKWELPVYNPDTPAETFEVVVKELKGAQYAELIIPATGWYKMETCSSGSSPNETGDKTAGAYSSGVCYLHKGDKVIMWGASVEATGYPLNNNDYGGRGAYNGRNESGGAGGSASSSGNKVHNDGGRGGSGAGIVARRIVLGVRTDITMCLSSGPGGVCGQNGEPRGSAGSGGSWGNGGGCDYATVPAETGPGGEWGAGNYGQNYGANQPKGIAAYRDMTTNVYRYASDSSGNNAAADGWCRLSWHYESGTPTQYTDLGMIVESAEDNIDCGRVTETATIKYDCGLIRKAS